MLSPYRNFRPRHSISEISTHAAPTARKFPPDLLQQCNMLARLMPALRNTADTSGTLKSRLGCVRHCEFTGRLLISTSKSVPDHTRPSKSYARRLKKPDLRPDQPPDYENIKRPPSVLRKHRPTGRGTPTAPPSKFRQLKALALKAIPTRNRAISTPGLKVPVLTTHALKGPPRGHGRRGPANQQPIARLLSKVVHGQQRLKRYRTSLSRKLSRLGAVSSW